MTLRLLTINDLPVMEEISKKKFEQSNTNLEFVFSDTNGLVFKNFVLTEDIHGYDRLRAFGYFDEDNNLLGMLGIRNLDYEPSWILSYIVTSKDCKNSLQIIKDLLHFALDYQEKKGKFQWFVISKLDKFRSWQRLFNSARSNYHHYVYGRVLANQMPKWLASLQLSSNKLFPYDINISMYMSKKLCTSGEDAEFDETDCTFI